jgi:pterin-4a-carbinolamine dehydratase
MASKKKVFISYRRSDSMYIAQALRVQLFQHFGPGSTFMDVASIPAGTEWPARLRAAVLEADVTLAVIGPNWLTAADEFGRRRLDQPKDWVRQELVTAIEANKHIVPVRVGGLPEMPDIEGMPAGLAHLCSCQDFELRDKAWDTDVSTLVRLLKDEYRFKDTHELVLLPRAQVNVEALTSEELEARLLTLPGWEPVESSTLRDYPRSRKEIRRAYVFKQFTDAIAFMAEAAPAIEASKHHPRWENQWRTVIVYLSTWDIGNRVSELDINLARKLDEIYRPYGN